jgi:hypothetical protein
MAVVAGEGPAAAAADADVDAADADEDADMMDEDEDEDEEPDTVEEAALKQLEKAKKVRRRKKEGAVVPAS